MNIKWSVTRLVAQLVAKGVLTLEQAQEVFSTAERASTVPDKRMYDVWYEVTARHMTHFGETGKMNDVPMAHDEACTFVSKVSKHKWRRVFLKEADKPAFVPDVRVFHGGVVDFDNLALGARFKYTLDSPTVYVKLGGDAVAAWSDKYPMRDDVVQDVYGSSRENRNVHLWERL